MSDILHLMLCVGDTFDWERLLARVGEHWPLLLAQIATYSYVYPGYRSNIPEWVYTRLIDRARTDLGRDSEDADFTKGPLISRFSFTIDVREWGFTDPRNDMVKEARNAPVVRAIAEADVWDERSEDRPAPEERSEGREDAAYLV